MFMFSHYTLNAFSPRVFIRYKRHACLMAVLLFICGNLLSGTAVGRRLVSRHSNRHVIDDLRLLFAVQPDCLPPAALEITHGGADLRHRTDRARPELCRQSSQRYEQSGHFIWLLFVLGGISRIVNGCQTRKQSGAGWNIFIGLLDLLIACLWLAMNPQQSWLFITAFIGVEMIFSAIGLLVLRNKMKHAQA